MFNLANDPGDEPVDTELDGGEWVVAIWRISHDKFKNMHSPTDRFHQLMERHLFMYCDSETDEFKQQIYTPGAQELLLHNRAKLKKVFKHYATLDQQGAGTGIPPRRNTTPEKGTKGGSVSELSHGEFRQMAKEAQVLDSTCTFAQLDAMFAALQGDLCVRGGAGMLYHEFLEALCGLAVFKFPMPTLPLQLKLRSFFEKFLYPNLKSAVGLKDTQA